tara:strand:- start:410 stop:649 length:240 start_codon:yes stop_codon:yes gene_type:complete
MAMTAEEKELRAIARFYKDAKMGFATNDGFYAIPCGGKAVIVIHNGERLRKCRNEDSARTFIAQYKKQNKKRKCTTKTQ